MSLRPLILGHRGASAVAPENTLAAFSRALIDGADGVEFDVRLSRDHIPVVIHDATLNRTGGVDRRVFDLTAQELQQIDAGSWFDKTQRNPAATFAGEKLPSLEQVYKFFSNNTGVLYVEMKCEKDEGAALAERVAEFTRAFGLVGRVVVESFDLSAIAAVKKIDAAIRTAALFEPKLSRPLSSLLRQRMIAAALETGAHEIALHHSLASARGVEKAKRAGMEVVVWTVDDPAWIETARALGIKALIANNPAAMLCHRDL
ncbi:MAG TPA: glycerophosphodiester phosphodiesterase family protein [Pyrinomonadaceae bacterium]|jgi:glycerophosphoryl diester phosphodiesterase